MKGAAASGCPKVNQSDRFDFLRVLAVVVFYQSKYYCHAGQYNHEESVNAGLLSLLSGLTSRAVEQVSYPSIKYARLL